MTGAIKIAAVDDHPIVRDTVPGWLAAHHGGTQVGDIQVGGNGVVGSEVVVVATAATVTELLAGPGRQANVVLLDLDLGDGSNVASNVAAIRAAGPEVLVLSASDQPLAVRAALQAGARGYALKSEPADQVRAAIREVAAGRDWISSRLAYIMATDEGGTAPALSHQERRALQLYATGLPLKSVARRMGIGEETAKQYLARVRQKYLLAGRASPTKIELYYRAVEDGHLPPPPYPPPPTA